MKKTQQFLTAGALALLVSLSACDNDDDSKGGQLSKNDAKTEIASFNSNATTDIQDIADAEGVKAMQDFFALEDTDPFGRIASDKNKLRAFLKDKGRQFRSVFGPSNGVSGRTHGEESFDFDANTGVYAWDPTEAVFVKTQQSSDAIEILFPTEGSATNNARFEITEYEEQLVQDEWDSYYEPTRILANLYVNDAKKASLDFEIDYDSEGFPTAASVELMITPYTASLSFDVNASTSSTISFSLSKIQSVLIATSATVKYSDSSKSEESVSSVEGFVQIKNLKLQGDVNVEASDVQDPDLNDFVHVALYANDEKVGDIVFVTENGQDVPYVEYADGSKEKLELVFQPVVDEIEDLTASLEDSNG